MTTIPSIREQILEHLKARFLRVYQNQGGQSVTWSKVQRAPYLQPEKQTGPLIAILDQAESKSDRVGQMDCSLTVITEFWYKMKVGDDPSTEANRMLSDIQLTMRSDVTCDGLSYDITELSNNLDVDSVTDSLVNGVIFWQVKYRHKFDDPTKVC